MPGQSLHFPIWLAEVNGDLGRTVFGALRRGSGLGSGEEQTNQKLLDARAGDSRVHHKKKSKESVWPPP